MRNMRLKNLYHKIEKTESMRQEEKGHRKTQKPIAKTLKSADPTHCCKKQQLLYLLIGYQKIVAGNSDFKIDQTSIIQCDFFFLLSALFVGQSREIPFLVVRAVTSLSTFQLFQVIDLKEV